MLYCVLVFVHSYMYIYVCELVYLFVNVTKAQCTVGVKESVADQSVLYCMCVCSGV